MSRWRSARDDGVPGGAHDTDRKERIMPRLDLGAVRATFRAALRAIDAWTLESLNSPAGGHRPR